MNPTMMTSDRQGLLCDKCGKELRRKFVYYSVEFTKVGVDADVKQVGPVDVDKKYLNLDICEGCYEDLKAICLAVIKRRERKT
jgi:hypothetical protein